MKVDLDVELGFRKDLKMAVMRVTLPHVLALGIDELVGRV